MRGGGWARGQGGPRLRWDQAGWLGEVSCVGTLRDWPTELGDGLMWCMRGGGGGGAVHAVLRCTLTVMCAVAMGGPVCPKPYGL